MTVGSQSLRREYDRMGIAFENGVYYVFTNVELPEGGMTSHIAGEFNSFEEAEKYILSIE